MKKLLTPLTVAIVLCTGYSLSWLKSQPPHKSNSQLSTHEFYNSEAVLRHKHCQPIHWRSMLLR